MDADERKPLIPKNRSTERSNTTLNGAANSSINADGHVVTEADVTEANVKKSDGQHVYRRRWYILLLFSLLGFMQNLVWNTWGPLADSVRIAFNWSKADVALQTNWGCITYIVLAPFFSWLMDVKGLRVSCVLTAALVAFGAALRCITTEPYPATILIHAGQILNGCAGPVLMAGPPVLSALWFPANQRTTSTSLSILLQCFGIAGSFLIGPLMVPNTQSSHNASLDTANSSNATDNDVMQTRYNIMKLMYIECVCSAVVFIAVLIYFPDKPPTAPSISAASERIDFKDGMRQLLRHWSFWKLSISYALALGIGSIWSSLLSFYVMDLIDETEAGWLGFYSAIAYGIAGCVISRFTDIYARRQKLVLIILFILSLAFCIVFTLECMKIIPFSRAVLYSTFICAAITLQGCSPLFYELVCETAFPVAEGLTNGIQTWLNNFVGLVFLLTFLIPAVGNSTDMQWMNWTMVAAIAVCIPILFTYKESYHRLDLDTIVVTN